MTEETIKICHETEVRRLVIHDSTTFSECIQVIKRVFPIMNNKIIHLLWKDEEQDSITISTNEEFQEARKIMKTMALGIPKFLIKVIKDAEIHEEIRDDKVNKVSDINPGKVHVHVQCDECHIKPIVGVRYKCTVRHNFDLCAKCEGKIIQPYPMVKISRPRQRPNHEQLIYKMLNANAGPTILSSDKKVCALEQSKQFQHIHIRCDECLMSPISGARFKCTLRDNFDLCANCEGKSKQPYPMVKIYDPKHNPSFLQYKMKCTHNADIKWRDKHHHQQHGKANFVSAMQDFFKANVAVVKAEKYDTTVNDTAANLNISKPAMRFVKDVTFPDGATVAPGQTFQKVWKVRNDGIVAWPEGVFLTSAGGDDVVVAVNNPGDTSGIVNIAGPLNVGEEKDLSAILTAPGKEGRYVSYFRLQTKEGRNFGQRLWADFVVVFTATSTSVKNSEATDDNIITIDNKTITVMEDNSSRSQTSVANEFNHLEGQCCCSLDVLATEKQVDDLVNITNDVSTEEIDGNWVNIQETVCESSTVIDVTLLAVEDEEPLFYPLHSSICYEDTETEEAPLSISCDHIDEDNYSRWKKELMLLTEMGFSDVQIIIPLLELHLKTPSPANTAGLQQVVATLLRLQQCVD